MFLYGNPVPPELFVGRRRELRHIVSRIANHGQSTALIGEPRSGKTSLLDYVRSGVGHEGAQKGASPRLTFAYLDAYTLPARFGHAEFWARVLEPLRQVARDGAEPLGAALRACEAAAFDQRTIEALLGSARATGVRLVALVDEFDVMVHQRVEDPAFFFGNFRSLFSRSEGALACVLASRAPLEALNEVAQRGGYTGSPYFNTMSELSLGPFSAEEIDVVLDRGMGRFSAEDRRYVHELSGGHPYLVQAAASALWSAYDEHSEPRARRGAASATLYGETARTLADICRRWPRDVRYVFAAVTIEHLDSLGGEFGSAAKGRLDRPVVDVEAFGAELELLSKQGFLAPTPATPSGWRVQPLIFLAWYTVELRRRASSAERWAAWLREQEWGDILSAPERHTWVELIRPGLCQAKVPLDLFTAIGATTTAIAGASPARPTTTRMTPAASAVARPVRVYLSYAPKDDDLRVELETHLAALKRAGLVETWCPKAILPGEEHRGRVDENLRAADVVLLCVSADYAASDYCYDVELALAMQRWSLGEAQVVPIIVRPAAIWQTLPFGKLEPLPSGGKPVSSWPNRDEAWVDVAQGILRVVERIARGERPAPP